MMFNVFVNNLDDKQKFAIYTLKKIFINNKGNSSDMTKVQIYHIYIIHQTPNTQKYKKPTIFSIKKIF